MRKITTTCFHTSFLVFISLSACSTSTTMNSFSSPDNPYLTEHTSEHAKMSENRPWNLENPPSIREISQVVKDETTQDHLEGIGEWWLFGPGLGHSILNIGTVVLFPPYALYLLGNAGLALAGEEPVRIINILPQGGTREVVNDTIDGICSVPGRLTAAASRRPYVEHLTHNEKIAHIHGSQMPENHMDMYQFDTK